MNTVIMERGSFRLHKRRVFLIGKSGFDDAEGFAVCYITAKKWGNDKGRETV